MTKVRDVPEAANLAFQGMGRRLRVYSVLDRKLREYGPLLVERNQEAMTRGLVTALRENRDHMMAKYPDDFDLYDLGAFDVETGEMVQVEIRLVGTVAGILAQFNGPSAEGV